DEAAEHSGDFVVVCIRGEAFSAADMAAILRDHELGPDLARGSPRSIQILSKMPVGRLLESFRDRRRDALGRGAHLFPQPNVAPKGLSLDDGKYFMRRDERFLINLQFFHAFRIHRLSRGTFRAGLTTVTLSTSPCSL